MPDPYADIIDAFNIYYRFLSTQTYDEANESPATNTDADILYSAFGLYADLAADELVNLLAARNIATTDITENQELVMLCHLVADHFEQGNPDWSFRSQSQAPGVSFSRGEKTGPRTALEKMLNEIQTATRMSSVTSGRGAAMTFNRVKDAVNFPKRWKRTSIPSYDPTTDGFDSEPVSDMGYEENDNNNSAW
jgi:hypothetical protein